MSYSGARNIIFDFGGVLFEIDYSAPVKAFAALGAGEFESVFSQASQHPEFDLLDTGSISTEEFLQFLHTFVPNASTTEILSAWNSILTGLWRERVHFVRTLRERGYRTFLLSNTNAIHVAAFEPMIESSMGMSAFREAFEKIYYSHLIRMRKPDPLTFLRVCEWNDLKPAETIFIDDSLQHIEGARAAGLLALHLSPGQNVINVLNDLPDFPKE